MLNPSFALRQVVRLGDEYKMQEFAVLERGVNAIRGAPLISVRCVSIIHWRAVIVSST